MRLPKQVQEANARADALGEELTKQARGGTAADEGGENAADEPNQDQTPDESTPEPKADDGKTADTKDDGKSEGDKEGEAGGRTDWKSKYLTLQGMFNADVPRLNAELKEAKARIDELSGKLETKQESDQKAQHETVSSELQQKLQDALGPDVAETISKIVDGRMEGSMDELRQAVDKNLEPVKQQASQAANTSTQTQFEIALSHQVPDWRQVDSAPGFQEWLGESDGLAGATRQEMLVQAYQAGDVQRVARFFETFKSLSDKVSDHGAASSNQAQPDPLAEQEAPSRAGSSPATPGDKPVFKREDVSRFYKDVALGKIPPKEAAEQEAQIVAAVKENRIR